MIILKYLNLLAASTIAFGNSVIVPVLQAIET